MLQCWQTNRTFVIKTLNFFPTKAVDFFWKNTTSESKTFLSKTIFLANRKLIWQPCQKWVTKKPRRNWCRTKQWTLINFFVETTFLEKIFLTRRMHSQQAQLKKFVVTFVVKSYGSETKKNQQNQFSRQEFFYSRHSSGQLRGSAKNVDPNFPPSF